MNIDICNTFEVYFQIFRNFGYKELKNSDIICRVTFSIVNYEFAHTANGRTKILFFGVCLTSRINPYDQDGILGRFRLG